MRHQMAKKHLGRTPSHRLAMRRNMARSLFVHGAVRTTEPKAKDLRRFVERLITFARSGTLHARRLVLKEMGDREIVDDEGEPTGQTVVQKLFGEIAPKYADRPGGYTRIIRLPERRIGDGGQTVMLQLVEESTGGGASQSASRRKRRAAKLHEAAEAVESSDAGGGLEDADQPESTDEQPEPQEQESAEEQSDQGPDEEKKE